MREPSSRDFETAKSEGFHKELLDFLSISARTPCGENDVLSALGVTLALTYALRGSVN